MRCCPWAPPRPHHARRRLFCARRHSYRDGAESSVVEPLTSAAAVATHGIIYSSYYFLLPPAHLLHGAAAPRTALLPACLDGRAARISASFYAGTTLIFLPPAGTQ